MTDCVLLYGVSHVHVPVAAGTDAASVDRRQQPEYHSSIFTLPLATCDPSAMKVTLNWLLVSHEKREPGTGDVTCSAPPSTVMTLDDTKIADVSTVDVSRM